MEKSPKELFKVWHLVFEKNYSLDTLEARQRFRTFKANLQLIKEHNAKNLSYKLGLNQFSDMTNAEFKQKMCTKKVVQGEELDQILDNFDKNSYSDDDDDDLTKRNLIAGKQAIDYTNSFSEARSQGNCGSCWAFASSGAVEGALGAKLSKSFPYLSPQQLVDCDTRNNGCNGGNTIWAFDYIVKNGIHYDSYYPYNEARGKCKYSSSAPLNKVIKYIYCTNYSNIKDRKCSIDKVYKLLTNGPGAVGVDAGTPEFQGYSSGIFSGTCTNDNHAVILAGYGISNDNVEYWIVRNSWGAFWGDNGYIKIKVNDGNKYSCFINNELIVPIV